MALTLGIDIGGTNVSFGVVGIDNHIYLKHKFKTKEFKSAQDCLKNIYEYISVNYSNYFQNITKVGIGAPMIDAHSGIMKNAANLNWAQPVNMRQLAIDIFGVEVRVENDANIVAYGEWKLGKAKNCNNSLIITIGTGVGGALIIDNSLYNGTTGYAGEIGHMIYERQGRACKCGRKGCYEKYISASGIVQTYQELKQRYDSPILTNLERSGIEIDPQLIYEAAKREDALALNVYAYTGEVLGFMMSDLICCLNPEKIILYGGILHTSDILLPFVMQSFEQHILGIYKNSVSIEVSDIDGEDMGILGASALFHN
jgi:glucokinase